MINFKITKRIKQEIGMIILFLLTTSFWIKTLQPKTLEGVLLIIVPVYYILLLSLTKKPVKYTDLGGIVLWISTFAVLIKVFETTFGYIGVLIVLGLIVLRIVYRGIKNPAFNQGLDIIQPYFDEWLPWRRKWKKKKKRMNQNKK